MTSIVRLSEEDTVSSGGTERERNPIVFEIQGLLVKNVIPMGLDRRSLRDDKAIPFTHGIAQEPTAKVDRFRREVLEFDGILERGIGVSQDLVNEDPCNRFRRQGSRRAAIPSTCHPEAAILEVLGAGFKLKRTSKAVRSHGPIPTITIIKFKQQSATGIHDRKLLALVGKLANVSADGLVDDLSGIGKFKGKEILDQEQALTRSQGEGWKGIIDAVDELSPLQVQGGVPAVLDLNELDIRAIGMMIHDFNRNELRFGSGSESSQDRQGADSGERSATVMAGLWGLFSGWLIHSTSVPLNLN